MSEFVLRNEPLVSPDRCISCASTSNVPFVDTRQLTLSAVSPEERRVFLCSACVTNVCGAVGVVSQILLEGVQAELRSKTAELIAAHEQLRSWDEDERAAMQRQLDDAVTRAATAEADAGVLRRQAEAARNAPTDRLLAKVAGSAKTSRRGGR